MSEDFIIKFDSKKLSQEYLLLELELGLNKELFDSKILSFDIFKRMESLIIKKQRKLAMEEMDEITSLSK